MTGRGGEDTEAGFLQGAGGGVAAAGRSPALPGGPRGPGGGGGGGGRGGPACWGGSGCAAHRPGAGNPKFPQIKWAESVDKQVRFVYNLVCWH